MEPTPALKQAIKDYKDGKAQAFDVLYNESSKYIYTCIYNVMCGNDNAQDAINDIMQDTFVEISRYISQLKDEEKFLSWAGTIATRKCYSYLDKNEKYVLLNEEDVTFDTLADNDDIIPEEIMQDREKQRLLREIINTELTKMQKLCVVAYYYNEQKQSEIAKELGIPENTVKTNLSRAKAKIKDGVLNLEKNKGTRLYSVVPFMLLLFKEEVYAAVVPQEITKSVFSSVAGVTVATQTAGTVGAAGTATVAGTVAAETAGTATSTVAAVGAKTAAISLKAKIIGAAVGLGITGAACGTIHMVAKTNEPSVMEREHKEEITENSTKKPTTKPTDKPMDEPVVEIPTEPVENIIEMSQEEQDSLGTLAHFFTETNLNIGLLEEGVLYPTQENVLSFIGFIGSHTMNTAYNTEPSFYDHCDKYLPTNNPDEEQPFLYAENIVNEYVSSVFGIELNIEESEKAFPAIKKVADRYVGNYWENSPTTDRCKIIKLVKDEDTYIATGVYTIGEQVSSEGTEIEFVDSYNFTMTLVQNSKSPFGYTLKSVKYEWVES